LEIVLKASAVEAEFQKSPLNLALILDRSGSMSGDKLEYVKQAAEHVVGLLDEKDRIALVDYDNNVRILFPSARLDPESRKTLLKAISSIHSGGTTNLSGGWLTGCQQDYVGSCFLCKCYLERSALARGAESCVRQWRCSNFAQFT
jgi:Ca-activated chloride channel homolog